MAEIIEESVVAASLMREALSLLSSPEMTVAAEHLQRALAALEDERTRSGREEGSGDGKGR